MTSAEDELVDALVRTSFEVMRIVTQVAGAHDVSVSQMRVFGILRDNEPRLSELAEYLGLDRSSVSGLIDRAEQRGLVERRADAADGRASRVRLTEQGRELATLAEREVAAGIAPIVAHVPARHRATIVGLCGATYPRGAE